MHRSGVGMKGWRRRTVRRTSLVCIFVLASAFIVVLLLYTLIPESVWNMPLIGGMEARQVQIWHTAPPDREVTDDEVFACARRWLRTDDVAAMDVIPFVVLPLTLEWADFRRFLCRVHARTRYLYVVQNGDVDEMTQLLARIRAAVPEERLIIRHHPGNIGYAAAVNEGYRAALAKSREEVPFVGVFNCDVYFERRYFRRYLPDVYAALAPDAARMAALEAEVEAEAAGPPTLRTAGIPGLSLSHLLPDLVRYAALESQRREFRGHVGMFHYGYQSMCAFLVSRLALLAGGFLDENCYPAYFEDYDWKLRMSQLGFRTFVGPSQRYGGFYHGLGGNLRVIKDGVAGRSVSHELEAARVARMLAARPGVDYGESKWGWHREAQVATGAEPFPLMDLTVPVDAWIVDEARLRHIVAVGLGMAPPMEMRNTYNLTLLEALRPFDRRGD